MNTIQTKTDHFFIIGNLIVFLASIWLFVVALTINIEYDDGYAAISNSQYFLGISPEYFWQRGPLMSFILIPSEWLSNTFNLHPLDVRLHHFTLSLLHILYLVFIWRYLVTSFSKSWIALLSFVSVILCYIFISYAPFLSHDILPGAALLAMLLLTERFCQNNNKKDWLLLLLIGFLITIFKLTFAIFWITILISRILPSLIFRTKLNKTDKKSIYYLIAAAGISGILTWLVYSYSIGFHFTEIPFWQRLYHYITTVSSMYAEEQELGYRVFPWWLYFKNLPAYGWSITLFIIPGLIIGFFSTNRFHQNLILVWILCFIILQLISFKEVRYLAFLMPLSAIIFAHTLAWLANKKYYPLIIFTFVLMSIDGINNLTEASVFIKNDFYKTEIENFFSVLTEKNSNAQQNTDKKIVLTNFFSFTPDNETSILDADRYHKVFHITDDELISLFGLKNAASLDNHKVKQLSQNHFKTGDILFFVNERIVRTEQNTDKKFLKSANFIQLSAIAKKISFVRKGKTYYLIHKENKRPKLLLHSKKSKENPVLIKDKVSQEKLSVLLGNRQLQAEEYLTGFSVYSFCDTNQCYHF